MRQLLKKTIAVGLGSVVISAAGFSGAAHAASSEEARYTHASCEGANAVCGVIVVASAGSFTLDWTAVNAHTAQPDNAHADCPGLDKKLTKNVPAGNYDTYVVPASCSYKLKLKILSGNSKDKNLFLTPGCQIIAKVSGTVGSNSWKTLEISTLSSQIPTNSDGKPIDGLGQKCGKLSGSGF